MSAETRAALDAAIATHIADEYEGDMASAWVVVAEVTTIEGLESGDGSMVVETRDMQSNYLTEGLLHAALMVGNRGDDE